jgi:heparin binding hemagglutinin HbhA
MATIESKDAKQALYAVAGVADLAVSAFRHLPEEAEKLRSRFPDEAARAYENLVQRGEALVTTIRKSRSTQQAVRATRIAVSTTKAARTRAGTSAKSTRSAARGASTTVRRAAEADAKAAQDAAGKVGEK